MTYYPVVVDCIKSQHKKYRKTLNQLGLRWTGSDCFIGNINQWRYESLSKFCKANRLKLRVNNKFGTRSTDYRKNYFFQNPPHLLNRYFCAYCGKLCRKRDITVDHIYPISKVKNRIKLQKKLKARGYRGINDVKNLVAACKKCNQRKGVNMGLWVLKGHLGKYPIIWVIRHMIRLGLLISLFYFIMTNNIGIIIQQFGELIIKCGMQLQNLPWY